MLHTESTQTEKMDLRQCDGNVERRVGCHHHTAYTIWWFSQCKDGLGECHICQDLQSKLSQVPEVEEEYPFVWHYNADAAELMEQFEEEDAHTLDMLDQKQQIQEALEEFSNSMYCD